MNHRLLQIERPPEGFKYGTIEGSYMADYFKNSNNTYFRHIWYYMQNNNVKSLSDGVEAARSGYVKFANKYGTFAATLSICKSCLT